MGNVRHWRTQSTTLCLAKTATFTKTMSEIKLPYTSDVSYMKMENSEQGW
jgi:hypothetical protein